MLFLFLECELSILGVAVLSNQHITTTQVGVTTTVVFSELLLNTFEGCALLARPVWQLGSILTGNTYFTANEFHLNQHFVTQFIMGPHVYNGKKTVLLSAHLVNLFNEYSAILCTCHEWVKLLI